MGNGGHPLRNRSPPLTDEKHSNMSWPLTARLIPLPWGGLTPSTRASSFHLRLHWNWHAPPPCPIPISVVHRISLRTSATPSIFPWLYRIMHTPPIALLNGVVRIQFIFPFDVVVVLVAPNGGP